MKQGLTSILALFLGSWQEGVSTGLGDTGDLSALVDEVIGTAPGDIIENLDGKIMQEDASQSLENIQDDENKTEHIKDT
ncbi:hypothetical protein R3W88_032064 [Solanum pinnatisectum]|uniref:Uncharacterized protein n=1 Tax=Solanum pinnatisectum TaxID=50273 RepID=A0AAV9LN31_9SOLN|nr:hypothetical protein R3W88_032064 [Solanum pinnatisectum]